MKFKQFMDLFDNWNCFVCVNDDYLRLIVKGRAHRIMDCLPPLSGRVESYEQLFDMEVVAFGFYDDELCVRVK